MYNTMIGSTSTRWFGARTAIASAVVLVALVCAFEAHQAHAQQGCRTECYPDMKLINSKGGGKNDNCRWVLRTDGKAARLCDHIKCRKVCPNNQAASSASQDQQGAASDNMRVEQQTESESPNSATGAAHDQPMGIMRHLHGSKITKAPVAGVAGGRLSQAGAAANGASGGFGPAPGASTSGRRSAPTLPPATSYDENDTPPPIARFLDISPEE